MRVVSGTARGTTLLAPGGLSTRPTADRIKESFFNIIAGEINDANVLDLFAGSGAIGIETLSRGAKFATFVDSSREAYDVITKNLVKTHLSDRSRVINKDFKKALEILGGAKFDFIFMDPPYGKNLVEEALSLIKKYNLLSESGFISAEVSCEDEMNSDLFEVYRIKEYSATKILFMRR